MSLYSPYMYHTRMNPSPGLPRGAGVTPLVTDQASLCTGELNATRKHKCFHCNPFYVKGVSLGHGGRNENLKDLQDAAKRVVSLLHVAVYVAYKP